MRIGRAVHIVGEREIDGIRFYQVRLPPEKSGWVQAEAVASQFKKSDDERFARLINASDGFDKIERAAVFLENFSTSAFLFSGSRLFKFASSRAASSVSGLTS